MSANAGSGGGSKTTLEVLFQLTGVEQSAASLQKMAPLWEAISRGAKQAGTDIQTFINNFKNLNTAATSLGTTSEAFVKVDTTAKTTAASTTNFANSLKTLTPSASSATSSITGLAASEEKLSSVTAQLISNQTKIGSSASQSASGIESLNKSMMGLSESLTRAQQSEQAFANSLNNANTSRNNAITNTGKYSSISKMSADSTDLSTASAERNANAHTNLASKVLNTGKSFSGVGLSMLMMTNTMSDQSLVAGNIAAQHEKVDEATQKLNETIQQYGKDSKQAIQASGELAKAQRGLQFEQREAAAQAHNMTFMIGLMAVEMIDKVAPALTQMTALTGKLKTGWADFVSGLSGSSLGRGLSGLSDIFGGISTSAKTAQSSAMELTGALSNNAAAMAAEEASAARVATGMDALRTSTVTSSAAVTESTTTLMANTAAETENVAATVEETTSKTAVNAALLANTTETTAGTTATLANTTSITANMAATAEDTTATAANTAATVENVSAIETEATSRAAVVTALEENNAAELANTEVMTANNAAIAEGDAVRSESIATIDLTSRSMQGAGIAAGENAAAMEAQAAASNAAATGIKTVGVESTRTGKLLALLGLTNPFFVALTVGGGLIAAFVTNMFGFRDAVNQVGVALGNAVPFLKGFLDMLGGAGKFLVDSFGMGSKAVTDYTKTTTKSLDVMSRAYDKNASDLDIMTAAITASTGAASTGVAGFSRDFITQMGNAQSAPSEVSNSVATMKDNIKTSLDTALADGDNFLNNFLKGEAAKTPGGGGSLPPGMNSLQSVLKQGMGAGGPGTGNITPLSALDGIRGFFGNIGNSLSSVFSGPPTASAQMAPSMKDQISFIGPPKPPSLQQTQLIPGFKPAGTSIGDVARNSGIFGPTGTLPKDMSAIANQPLLTNSSGQFVADSQKLNTALAAVGITGKDATNTIDRLGSSLKIQTATTTQAATQTTALANSHKQAATTTQNTTAADQGLANASMGLVNIGLQAGQVTTDNTVKTKEAEKENNNLWNTNLKLGESHQAVATATQQATKGTQTHAAATSNSIKSITNLVSGNKVLAQQIGKNAEGWNAYNQILGSSVLTEQAVKIATLGSQEAMAENAVGVLQNITAQQNYNGQLNTSQGQMVAFGEGAVGMMTDLNKTKASVFENQGALFVLNAALADGSAQTDAYNNAVEEQGLKLAKTRVETAATEGTAAKMHAQYVSGESTIISYNKGFADQALALEQTKVATDETAGTVDQLHQQYASGESRIAAYNKGLTTQNEKLEQTKVATDETVGTIVAMDLQYKSGESILAAYNKGVADQALKLEQLKVSNIETAANAAEMHAEYVNGSSIVANYTKGMADQALKLEQTKAATIATMGTVGQMNLQFQSGESIQANFNKGFADQVLVMTTARDKMAETQGAVAAMSAAFTTGWPQVIAYGNAYQDTMKKIEESKVAVFGLQGTLAALNEKMDTEKVTAWATGFYNAKIAFTQSTIALKEQEGGIAALVQEIDNGSAAQQAYSKGILDTRKNILDQVVALSSNAAAIDENNRAVTSGLATSIAYNKALQDQAQNVLALATAYGTSIGNVVAMQANMRNASTQMEQFNTGFAKGLEDVTTWAAGIKGAQGAVQGTFEGIVESAKVLGVQMPAGFRLSADAAKEWIGVIAGAPDVLSKLTDQANSAADSIAETMAKAFDPESGGKKGGGLKDTFKKLEKDWGVKLNGAVKGALSTMGQEKELQSTLDAQFGALIGAINIDPAAAEQSCWNYAQNNR